MPIPLGEDFDACLCQAAAKRSKDGPQACRLLALAAIYEGASRSAALVLPRGAVQAFGGEQAVFVRSAQGFEKRVVGLGHVDDGLVEVVSGLRAGEAVAVSNTFVLKAELLKGHGED